MSRMLGSTPWVGVLRYALVSVTGRVATDSPGHEYGHRDKGRHSWRPIGRSCRFQFLEQSDRLGQCKYCQRDGLQDRQYHRLHSDCDHCRGCSRGHEYGRFP